MNKSWRRINSRESIFLNPTLPIYARYTLAYLVVTIVGTYIGTKLAAIPTVYERAEKADKQNVSDSVEAKDAGSKTDDAGKPKFEDSPDDTAKSSSDKPRVRKPREKKKRPTSKDSENVSDADQQDQPPADPSPAAIQSWQKIEEPKQPYPNKRNESSETLKSSSVAPKVEPARRPEAPEPIYQPIIEYPRLAKQAGIWADGVTLLVGVAPDGSVKDAKEAGRKSNPILVDAAKKMVKSWRYTPYDATDPSERYWIEVKVNFRLH